MELEKTLETNRTQVGHANKGLELDSLCCYGGRPGFKDGYRHKCSFETANCTRIETNTGRPARPPVPQLVNLLRCFSLLVLDLVALHSVEPLAVDLIIIFLYYYLFVLHSKPGVRRRLCNTNQHLYMCFPCLLSLRMCQ